MSLDILKKVYSEKSADIKKRLDDFKSILSLGDERLFAELAFCLCTPQSKATVCWNAVETLMKNRLLFEGTKEQIKPFLNSVRFNENKSNYIMEAREKFPQIKEKILNTKDIVELRDWLFENVKGIGMKECGHFLRNIGLGNELAILDVHILNNLIEHGVIEEFPNSMSKKKYLEIEQKMKKFSQNIGIPMGELDLLFWSQRTGFIFK
ncbi:MAG TPA: N-glycosylase/DNA lyase [archaeon]|nr:N-glycosylase/DNA lyase [archaeon]